MQLPTTRSRKLIWFEVVTVVAVTLGSAIVSAALLLTEYLAAGRRSNLVVARLVGHPVLDGTVEAIAVLFSLIPALLIAYVMTAAGESLTDLGLTRLPTGRDAARALGLVAMILGGGMVLFPILRAFGVHPIVTDFDPASHHWAYLPAGLLVALRSGVLEELVVVGYLLRRLQQLGWSDRNAVIASLVLRCSYHLYGGVLLVSFTIAFGAILTWSFRRTGRLWPLILAHVVWDSIAVTAALAH